MRKSDFVALIILATCVTAIGFFIFHVSRQYSKENALSKNGPITTLLLFKDKGNKLVLSNDFL